MRKIIAILFFALIATPVFAASNSKSAGTKNPKTIQLQDNDILDAKPSAEICCDDNAYDAEDPTVDDYRLASQNADDQDTVQSTKVSPEFNYSKRDEDYNDRLDQYDARAKVKVKIPVDF